MAKHIHDAYEIARERYAELGVDTEKVLQKMERFPLSMHCWQGDDVCGFENPADELDGGIQATGNYPGKARTPEQLRADIDKALHLVPGTHRLNLHAIYLDPGGKRVDRNELEPEHFAAWIDFARERGMGMDFNPTFFSHPKASDGLTLIHPDKGIRQFWIEHAQACRKVGAAMGEATGTPCVNNVWVPDGYKDTPADRKTPRERLAASLDEVFAESYDPNYLLDSVESKLFGIGSESFVPGSHEFYMGYAMRNDKLLCLDTGHFHPTESVADKVSAVMLWLDGLMLHVSRGVRWDSDHVVTLTDDVIALAQAIVRGGYEERVHIGLDFFDASINRVGAWVVGMRSTLRAFLYALLEPEQLQQAEKNGDLTRRLALMEELKSMPFQAVWDEYCARQNVPIGTDWIEEVKAYENSVQKKRDGAG
mgnify:CR=1 FL=1